jgi:hypothetical protein
MSFSAPHIRAKLVSPAQPCPKPKGTPIQSQRVHPARSAALQWAVTDVATVESVPDFATGKTRNVT